MIAFGFKHEGRAAKSAPVAAVYVLGAAAEKGVRDTELLLPDPGPPPSLGEGALDPGADDAILTSERSQVLLNFNLRI